MKLNHLNLTVTDVLETRQFLEKYFGLRTIDGIGDKESIAVMFDDNELMLVLLKLDGTTKVEYPASFHIGFMQESEERVNQINQLLQDDGFDVKPPCRLHDTWTFFLNAPDGFTIEVLCWSDIFERLHLN